MFDFYWHFQPHNVYENSLSSDIYEQEKYKEALSLLRCDYVC